MISNYSKPIRVRASVSAWKNLVFVFVNAIWGAPLVAPAAKKTTMMLTNVNIVHDASFSYFSVSSKN